MCSVGAGRNVECLDMTAGWLQDDWRSCHSSRLGGHKSSCYWNKIVINVGTLSERDTILPPHANHRTQSKAKQFPDKIPCKIGTPSLSLSPCLVKTPCTPIYICIAYGSYGIISFSLEPQLQSPQAFPAWSMHISMRWRKITAKNLFLSYRKQLLYTFLTLNIPWPM